MGRPDDLLMDVEHVPVEHAVLVTVRGEVDSTNASGLTTTIAGAIDLAVRTRSRLLVVDLSAVGFFGSAGLAALVNAGRDAQRHGVDMNVVAAEGSVVENVLIITAAISVLTVRISVDHTYQAARATGEKADRRANRPSG